MKQGAENRKKTVLLGVLSAAAFSGILYDLYAVFGHPSTPPPTVAPLSSAPAPVLRNSSSPSSAGGNARAGQGGNAVAGVAATKLASTSASLDPTLDQTAMLRTESLVYSGSGRNIFSATYTAPAAAMPTHVPPARPLPVGPPMPVAPMGPPPPPPIPLKFFGTAQRGGRLKQAFLLSGEDVYLASVGDIVAKRFKVVQILAYGVQITDLVSNNTQTLPMSQQ
ncbi:MAG: hypothetical protein ACRYFU_09635 [Janthinobacterium lividum]